jgi:hypothetical protein
MTELRGSPSSGIRRAFAWPTRVAEHLRTNRNLRNGISKLWWGIHGFGRCASAMHRRALGRRGSMLWNVIAIVLSALALASSTIIAVRQSALMHRSNHIPTYVDMAGEFRSLEFNNHYRFITERLAAEYDPQLGISGLPDDAREAIYNVAGLFQSIASLRLLGILDERATVMFQVRIVRAWSALAPFVERERELQGTPNRYLWRVLEEFAADIKLLPDDAVNRLIAEHRRRRLRRHPGARVVALVGSVLSRVRTWKAVLTEGISGPSRDDSSAPSASPPTTPSQ